MRINGRELRDVHPAISIAKEIPPGMATRTIHTIIGADAEIYAGTTMERGEYEVRINIAGKSMAEAWRVRAMIAEWAMGGSEGLCELEPTHWPGVAYDAIIESLSPPEIVFGFAKVTAIFALPRPVAHEIIVSRAAGSGSAVMQIGGSLAPRPAIRQTIKASRTGLTLSLDDKPFFVVQGALKAGQEVEIDTQDGSITIDGAQAQARIDYTATTWAPGFTPGRHTLTSSDAGAIETRWHNVWM